MSISEKRAKELLELSKSDSLIKHMQTATMQRHNPFFKDHEINVDSYIEFVTEFNESINYEPKPFLPTIDNIMRL